jgi:2-pyrone-4,6-dicarboxylate lactonase
VSAPPALPVCAPPDASPIRPKTRAPAGACDSHAHVFGPAARYPYAPGRGYTPPDAPLEAYLAMHEALGIARGVLVQPSVYGTDNRAILDAAARHPDRLRTVVAVDGTVSDAALSRLHAAGARGIRINLADKGGMPFASFAEVARFAERLRPLGWHVELLLHVHETPDLEALLGRFPVDAVIGHLGYMPAARGLGDPAFQALLALMGGGRCWVKLTAPYRLTARHALPYDDVAPLARALVAARPDRILWGSDWPHPHIRTKVAMPNDGAMFDQFADWVPDDAMRRRILVDNPAILYGFP